jgi:hypothetical protein
MRGTTARSRHASVTPNEFEFEVEVKFEDEDEDESRPECAAVHVAAATVRQVLCISFLANDHGQFLALILR